MNICACYHPPKPIYDTALFRPQLMDNVMDILEKESDCIFVLTGDLNTLNTSDPQTELGFDQIVNVPTHGATY